MHEARVARSDERRKLPLPGQDGRDDEAWHPQRELLHRRCGKYRTFGAAERDGPAESPLRDEFGRDRARAVAHSLDRAATAARLLQVAQ